LCGEITKHTGFIDFWGRMLRKVAEKITHYYPEAALVDDEEIAFFMSDAFETGDASIIAEALCIVTNAKGMTAVKALTAKQPESN
jgi:probable addiction module antidote protein